MDVYKIVLSYLRNLEARSIPALEDQVEIASEIFSDAMDKVPKKFEDEGYDFKDSVEKGSNEDGFFYYFYNALEDLFYSDRRRDALKIDFHIRYEKDLNGMRAEKRSGSTIELIFGKNFLVNIISGWYYKGDKKKFIDEIKTEIGHETIHSQQSGIFRLDSNKISPMNDEVSKQLEPYRIKLKEFTSPLNGLISDYIDKEGRKKFLDGFRKYYTKLLNDSVIREGVVPPYLKDLYHGVINTLPPGLVRQALKHNAYMLDEKVVSKYRGYTVDKEWYSYISDPREIMSYAYSLVSKAYRSGMPKGELLKALSAPESYKEELYPLEFYSEFKKFEGDKNFSSQEKRKIWQNFLKHVHGYIEQFYREQKDS